MNKSALALLVAASLCLTAFRNPPGALRYVEMAEKSIGDGETELALDYYAKAVASEPDNPQSYTSRGFFLLKLKRHAEALRDFSTLIKLTPGDPAGYLTRGLVYSELNRNAEAEADFSAACSLGSKDGCGFAAGK